LLLGGVVVSLVKTRGEKAEIQPKQPANAGGEFSNKKEDPQMRV